MKRIRVLCACGLIAWLPLSCNSASIPDLTSGDGGPSVGDVPDDGSPVVPQAAVSARVRNESSARADVTLRFVRDSKIVHLAFVRVLPDTITTVTSPESAQTLEVSGVDSRGDAIEEVVFVFGVDFDADIPAEYILQDALDPDPIDPVTPSPVAPRVTLVEPSGELTVALGSTFTARWTDAGGSSGTIVTVFMRPVGSNSAADRVAVGPGIGALLDGINDELRVVVQDVEPGLYDVLAVIEDGSRSAVSAAPGQIRVVRDPDNVTPAVEIQSPGSTVELRNGDFLSLAWNDTDPDDNATITFELASSQRADVVAHVLSIAPPIAENPDGTTADATNVVIRGALPGFYDLVATIDDGQLIGTDRVDRAVKILPDPNNDPPVLTLLQPEQDTQVIVGRTLLIRWEDADANDDARISLLLDPDVGNVPLDGDELLLVASLGEDSEGPGDSITLGIPAETPAGTYRLVGVISDGLTQLLTRAPGLVHLVNPTAQPPGNTNDNTTDDNTNDNADDNTNTNDNGNTNDNSDNGNSNDNSGGSGGGIIIIEPPIPPSPPPITVSPLDIDGAIVVAPAEELSVMFESSVVDHIDRAPSRIYLSNLNYGGRVRVDATPVDFPPPDLDLRTQAVPVRTDVVPNAEWPRQFDVEIETVEAGQVEVIVSTRPVWIVQAVEVQGAALGGGLTCIPVLDDGATPVEATITWYGGGIQETGPQAVVRFWLSADGLAPVGSEGDALHRMIAELPASPNVMQTTTIDLAAALARQASDTDSRLSPQLPLLVAGPYSIVTVLDPSGPMPSISDPFLSALSVCGPRTDGKLP